MREPYYIDCYQCETTHEIHEPDSWIIAGLPLWSWMYREGWTKSVAFGWKCPDCSREQAHVS